MPQIILYLDEKENEIIEKLSSKWNISKHDTIKKIIKKC